MLAKLHYIVILHQTTTVKLAFNLIIGCIISLFYIKPQRWRGTTTPTTVALYRYSTSNHNNSCSPSPTWKVALYRYSTSNHNARPYPLTLLLLHYIVILHQTTTAIRPSRTWSGLHYIVILHQTTTILAFKKFQICCIISLFYIKPQP